MIFRIHTTYSFHQRNSVPHAAANIILVLDRNLISYTAIMDK